MQAQLAAIHIVRAAFAAKLWMLKACITSNNLVQKQIIIPGTLNVCMILYVCMTDQAPVMGSIDW